MVEGNASEVNATALAVDAKSCDLRHFTGEPGLGMGKTGLCAALEEVSEFIRWYVFLTSDQLVAITLWVAHCHAFEWAEATPYLNIHSPEKRSGKSRLLEVLSLLVPRPWPTGRVTPAVLLRKVDAEVPTLLLDESDAAFRSDRQYSEALRAILDFGWRRGGQATICVKRGGDWVPRNFSSFCPKAIAGIGRLPDTIADRAIPIEMKRKTAGEHVARFRYREAERVATRLRGNLASASQGCGPQLATARPETPQQLDDRSAEIWEPLVAIAEIAGGDWPTQAHKAAVVLCAERAEDDDSCGVKLLRDIRAIFVKKVVDRLSSAELVEALVTRDESTWADWYGRPLDQARVARLLRSYRVRPKTIRFGASTLRGYEAADFADAWSRYLDTPTEPDPADTTVIGAPTTLVQAQAAVSVTRNSPETADARAHHIVADVSAVVDVKRRACQLTEQLNSLPLPREAATTATTRNGPALCFKKAPETDRNEPTTEIDALRNRLVELGATLDWPAGVGIRAGEMIARGEKGWRTFAKAASIGLLLRAIASAEAARRKDEHSRCD